MLGFKLTAIILCLVCFNVSADDKTSCSDILNTSVKKLNSNTEINLCSEYKGKVLLIVNTASKCAYTPQYTGLEALYKKYKDQGLVVLGFPSNDFGAQEPGTEAQIKEFCELTYNVKFPLFSKTKVRKANADPLYKKLGSISGQYPIWNFHKYLIDRKGDLIASYTSKVTPSNTVLVDKIKSALK